MGTLFRARVALRPRGFPGGVLLRPSPSDAVAHRCAGLTPVPEAAQLHDRRHCSHVAEGARDLLQKYVCYSLPHRTLLRLEGQDTSSFLQGIITNDTGLLAEPGPRAVYSHMLNVQGRTLYDIILYR